jgi:hypothetical protein
MMFVRAHPVETDFSSVNEFVERVVVILRTQFAIADALEWQREPGGVVRFIEVIREIPIRHQVEAGYFHRELSSSVCGNGLAVDINAVAVFDH